MSGSTIVQIDDLATDVAADLVLAEAQELLVLNCSRAFAKHIAEPPVERFGDGAENSHREPLIVPVMDVPLVPSNANNDDKHKFKLTEGTSSCSSRRSCCT